MKKLLAVFAMALLATTALVSAGNAANCNTGGHANPASSGAVYAGTDDCGRTNGAATVNSPAELPDDHPIGQVTFN